MKLVVILTLIDCVLVLAMSIIYAHYQESAFVRIGPHSDTEVSGFKIDTFSKYISVMIFLAAFTAFQTCRETVVYPWIMNYVYDDKQKKLDSYKPSEIYFVTSCNYFCDGIWYIVGIWLATSQIDFALMRCIVSTITNTYIVRMHVNKKISDDLTLLNGDNMV